MLRPGWPPRVLNTRSCGGLQWPVAPGSVQHRISRSITSVGMCPAWCGGFSSPRRRGCGGVSAGFCPAGWSDLGHRAVSQAAAPRTNTVQRYTPADTDRAGRLWRMA